MNLETWLLFSGAALIVILIPGPLSLLMISNSLNYGLRRSYPAFLGGVFASIYGTLALLQDHERARVKGVIINKFRGDVALLYSGIEQIEALTNVPVLGVMPWLEVDLEDEDGVALQKGKYRNL